MLENVNKKYLSIIVIVGLFAVLMFSGQVLQGSDTQTMSFAESTTTVVFGMTGYKDGVPVTEPIYQQAGFLYEGVEVDAVDLFVYVTAAGTDVDWTTFTMTIKTSVANLEFPNASGLALHTFTFVFTDMGINVDGTLYTAAANHMIDDLDYIMPGDPVETLADGTKIYNLQIWADVEGSVTDYNGNIITDSARATIVFVFTSHPDGTLDLNISEV